MPDTPVLSSVDMMMGMMAKLPLLQGDPISSLSDEQLEEMLSTCLYCSSRIHGVEYRALHINTYHAQEHKG